MKKKVNFIFLILLLEGVVEKLIQACPK